CVGQHIASSSDRRYGRHASPTTCQIRLTLARGPTRRRIPVDYSIGCRLAPTSGRPMRRALFGRSVSFLVSDNRLKKADDLLLPGSHDVELPAHLGEFVVDVRTEAD